ncbi:MAG: MBL fold metallo-hydrolase [Ketobacter sp.]|nr:MBL fold metallo-hydrolase [Ketobacter sp.]
MRITLIGHACILCEVEGLNFLIDANLGETFREGTFSFKPDRRVHVDRLPKPDVVLISHRHRDHFDLRSLNLLNRDTTVVYPMDEIIAYALKRLGFRNVIPVRPWEVLKFQDTVQIVATPSCFATDNFGECGFAIIADDGCFWDLADTVISTEIVYTMEQLIEQIDVTFYPFQPMVQSGIARNQPNSFPYNHYTEILRHLQLLPTRSLVPSSCGYMVRGDNAWINHFKFPITRERFAHDVAQIAPDINVLIADPGDVVNISKNSLSLTQQDATNEFVQGICSDSDQTIAFNPVMQIDPLVDKIRPGESSKEQHTEIQAFYEVCRQRIGNADTAWKLWFDFGLTYEFAITYIDGRESLLIDFSQNPVYIGESKTKGPADFTMECTATAFLGLVQGKLHFDHQLGGAIRTYTCMYRVTSYGVQNLKQLIPEYSEEYLDAFGLLRRLLNHDGQYEWRLIEYELDKIVSDNLSAGLDY